MTVTAAQTLYDNLIGLVGGHYYDVKEYGNSAFGFATDGLGGLLGFQNTFAPVVPPALGPAASPATFAAPTAISSSIGAFVAPPEPPLPELARRELEDTAGEAPRRPASIDAALAYTEPTSPTAAAPRPNYGSAPTLETVSFDDLTLPADDTVDRPEFFDIVVPDFDELDLPTLAAVRPTIDFTVEETPFQFSEAAYSSDLLTQVQGRISIMLDGGTGLPAHIEQALFDRARTREQQTATAALQQVREDFASRGFEQPDGILSKQLSRVRQNNQNQANTLSREIRLQNAQAEIENLRWAVAQSITLEQVLLGAHTAVEERRFQAAKYAHEALNALLDARIALHNAEVEAYKADLVVWREETEALLAILKSRVDLANTTADINKAIADRFDSEIRGRMREVERFAAQVQARRGKLEGQAQLLEKWRLQIQAYTDGELGAYSAQWNAFGTHAQAKLGKVQAGEIAVRAHAADVAAWSSTRQADIEKLRAELSTDQMSLQLVAEQMRRYLALVQTEQARMSSEADAKRSEAAVMAANAAVRQTEADVINRGVQLKIEDARMRGDFGLKAAEINLQAAIQTLQQQLQSMQTVAQVAGQIAAASLSAINISGSLSGSVNRGISFNYSGDIP